VLRLGELEVRTFECMRKSLFFILFVISFRLSAQQHAVYQYPQIYFDRGVELYEEGRFNAAISQFDQYFRSASSTSVNADASFYYSMSKLKAEHEDAVATVESYLDQNPNSVKRPLANLTLGDYFYKKEKYSPALSYFRNVDLGGVSLELRDQFLFRKGFCLVFTKKYKDAKETLEPVTKKGGQFQSLSKYYYGYACLMEKDYESALIAFQSIKDKKLEKVRFYIAQVYYQLSKYDEAISELNQIQPSSKISVKEIEWLKGKCFFRKKNYEQASLAFVKSQMTADKMIAEEQFEVGYAFAKSNDYNSSLSWFRLIAKNNDSLAQIASFELGNSLLKLKNMREAMNAFSEVWRTGFNEEIAEIALFTQAKLAVQLGESNSTTLLDKYIKLFPKTANAKEAAKLKARLLLNTDKYREAVAILEGIEDLDVQTEEIYQKVTLARGMELFKSRNFDAAIQLFEKCNKKSANKQYAAEATYWLAEAYMQQGKSDQAQVAYKSFLDMPHSNKIEIFPYAYYGLGYLQFLKKSYGDAAIYFNEFTTKVTGLRYDERLVHDAYLRLGDCYIMTRQLENSVKAYAYVSGKNGADADYALYQSGIIYGLLEKSDEKIGALKRLNKNYSKSRFTIDAYNDIASEYMQMKRFKDAEEYYQKILREFPGSQLTAKAYSTLGKIYFNDKKIDLSVNAYTQLYDNFQGTNEAKSAAEMVKTIYTDAGRAKDFVKWAATRGGLSKMEEDSLMFETAMNAYEREDFDVAVKSFDSYLQEMQNGNFVISAHYYKALTHESLKQPQKAIESYQFVAKANSGEFKEDATLSVLRIYGNNATCDEILPYVEILEQITKSKDIQRRAWKSLMYCYSKSNNSEGLKAVATKVMDDNSSDEDMKFESKMILAKADIASGDRPKAFASLKAIYDGNTNRFAAEAKYLESELYLTIDSIETCKNGCYSVLDLFNGYDLWVGKSLLLLGDAFAKENDMFNAKVTWNTIIESFTDKALLAEAKKRIKDNQLDAPEKKK
jgi:tetratricopeptide (TPR) repeat protein